MRCSFLIFLLVCNNIAFSASFDKMKKEIIRAEGVAFTITKFDKGGATKFGIVKQTWFGWCKIPEINVCDKNKNGKKDDYDIALINLNEAFIIYKKGYWDQWKCDNIEHQEIAEMLCDWVINQGLGKNRKYVKLVQKVLKIRQTGLISEHLIKEINNTDPHKFLVSLTKERLYLYDNIIKKDKTQIKFKRSWYNRTIYILKKYERKNNLNETYKFI